LTGINDRRRRGCHRDAIELPSSAAAPASVRAIAKQSLMVNAGLR
jgi:hypothetical protein